MTYNDVILNKKDKKRSKNQRQMRFDVKPNIIKVKIKYVIQKYKKFLTKKDIKVNQDVKISYYCIIKIYNFFIITVSNMETAL